MNEHRAKIREFIRQAQKIGQAEGLLVSGGGSPQEDGSYIITIRIRFPENKPGAESPEEGLTISGRGEPRDDGSYLIRMPVRFPNEPGENEPGGKSQDGLETQDDPETQAGTTAAGREERENAIPA